MKEDKNKQDLKLKNQKNEKKRKNIKKECESFDYNSLCLSYENENKNLFKKYDNQKSIIFL